MRFADIGLLFAIITSYTWFPPDDSQQRRRRMPMIKKLQRRFGRFAIPHITEGLIACQVMAYIFALGNSAFTSGIALVPERVLAGEVWRLFTFLCQPPPMHPVFLLFFWYMFYLIGAALENTWGAFRYNIYLLVGWLATVAVSFLQPAEPASFMFLQASVFLAFAYLYPDFQLLLFFILPVKVKWLALLQGLFYLYAILVGDLMTKLLVASALCNFALFFWHDIWLRAKAGQRRMVRQSEQIRRANTPRHRCVVCGVTNLSDPQMGFRYCSKCAGNPCYCENHIREHEHIVVAQMVE